MQASCQVNLKNERKHNLLISEINEGIITEFIHTKKIINKNNRKVYAHKFDNLDEIDQFLER